jgi:3-methyl-2-oxobutanoate hydroxymethyltransferase
MIEACKSVHRGNKSAFIVGDMPFGSYQISTEDAVRNAFRLVKEGGAEAIKLEGGEEMASTVRRIVDSGIIVVGHIGLTPQSQAALGGFRVQGKTADKAAQLLNSALALQKAGCSFLVIEAVPSAVASLISQHLTIPTIGIGCGGSCSGQVLVQMDMLGATIGHTPK